MWVSGLSVSGCASLVWRFQPREQAIRTAWTVLRCYGAVKGGGGYRHEFEAVAGVVDEEGEEEEGLDVLDGGCFEGRFGEHVGVERGFELLGCAVGGGLET